MQLTQAITLKITWLNHAGQVAERIKACNLSRTVFTGCGFEPSPAKICYLLLFRDFHSELTKTATLSMKLKVQS